MIQIFKKVDETSWQLIEEMQDDIALAQRLIDLRMDGSEYVSEERKGSESRILDL